MAVVRNLSKNAAFLSFHGHNESPSGQMNKTGVAATAIGTYTYTHIFIYTQI